MFAALMCGGCTVIYSNELLLQTAAFVQQVDDDRVGVLELVPSYLYAILQEKTTVPLKHLQYLLVTGETVSQSLLQQWFSHQHYGRIPVVNAYGPTKRAAAKRMGKIGRNGGKGRQYR